MGRHTFDVLKYEQNYRGGEAPVRVADLMPEAEATAKVSRFAKMLNFVRGERSETSARPEKSRTRRLAEAAFALASTAGIVFGAAPSSAEIPGRVPVSQAGEPMYTGYDRQETGESPIVFSDGIGGGNGLAPMEYNGRTLVGVEHPGTALNVGVDTPIPGVGDSSYGATVDTGRNRMVQTVLQTGSKDIRGYSAGGDVVQEAAPVIVANRPGEALYVTKGGAPDTDGGIANEVNDGPLKPIKPVLDLLGFTLEPGNDNDRLPAEVKMTENRVYGDPFAYGFFDDNGNPLPLDVILKGVDAHYGLTGPSPYNPDRFRVDETHTRIGENGAEITTNTMYPDSQPAPHSSVPAFAVAPATAEIIPQYVAEEEPVFTNPDVGNGYQATVGAVEQLNLDPGVTQQAETALESIAAQADQAIADTQAAYNNALAQLGLAPR